MDLKEVEILGEAQDTHWYYVSKARALVRALDGRSPTRILDVGAGSGFFSKVLLRETQAVGAICVDTGYTDRRLEAYREGQPKALSDPRTMRDSPATEAAAASVHAHEPERHRADSVQRAAERRV